MFVCALRLYPGTPGLGVLCGCVCSGSGFGCAPPLRAGMLGCACVNVRAPLVSRHSWRGVQCGCVCLGSGTGCAPPLLLGVFGCVCVCVRSPPVPRHSWLGCAVRVCVLGLGFLLCPANSGWGVRVFASLCTLFLYPAIPGWGLWLAGWVLPGTSSCAVVRCGWCALPGFAAAGGFFCLACVSVPWLWPAACLSCVARGAALVRRASSSLVTLGAPVKFLTPWCLSPPRGPAPPDLVGGCAGHVEAGREPGSLCLLLAAAKAEALGSPRVVPVRAPAMGSSLAGPSGVGVGLRRCGGLACADPVTEACRFLYCPSFDEGDGRFVWCCRLWCPVCLAWCCVACL